MTSTRHWRGLAVATLTLLLAACGDNLKPPAEDADAAVDAAAGVCGNGTVEAGEDCDDGDQVADAVCDAACHFTCGDGIVQAEFGELCDPGAAGAGACPTACDDGMACTADVLAGSGCQAACMSSAITVAVDGDGCCPIGATAATDSDCAPGCGNGVVDAGETCDTAIASGAGACPTTCNDGQACTTDALVAGGTCQAACTATPITTPVNGDGCCPTGATPATDTDCVPGCGNGIVDPGETCDRAIPVGPGACPTTCSDGMACTRDVLTGGGTCTAACTFPPITMPANGDGCCPAGANNTTDSDCAPRCGNGVVETGEQCDDGNMNNTDACSNTCTLTSATPTAFRFRDLDLRDPHVFVNVVVCRDMTDTGLLTFPGVNPLIQTNIQTDGADANTLLDLSIVTLFRPLNQATSASTPLEIHFPGCTSPIGATVCSRTPPASPAVPTMSTNGVAPCLGPVPGSTGGYMPAITQPVAPCYASAATTVTIDVAGIPVTLTDARVAATYVGNPATSTVNGLLVGFISEAQANMTVLPMSLPLVGGQPLSSILAGGAGNCSNRNDKDVNNGVPGWWFYMNFTADRVTWIDN
ncbi:MAG: DUF4215 domain-containing protein [Kofleriaceae bacterium]